MAIEGIGDFLVDQHVERWLVHTCADLYKLKPDTIATLTSEVEQGGKIVTRTVGEKVAQKVVNNIEKSKSQQLDRLLAGLGIRHVGTRVAYVLASHFGSLDAIAKASCDELSSVHEIGEVIADSVHDFFHNASGKAAIDALKKIGIDPTFEKPASSGALPLAGKT